MTKTAKKIDGVSVYLPVRTISEANQREHWAVKNKRKNQQQQLTHMMLERVKAALKAKKWKRIKLTRFGKRDMDADNLAGSFKHVQDAIAAFIGVDDGKIKWEYAQDRGDYAVRANFR